MEPSVRWDFYIGDWIDWTWSKLFMQVRPYGWKDHEILITLNVDTAHKPAARNLHLTNESAPGKGDSYTQQVEYE